MTFKSLEYKHRFPNDPMKSLISIGHKFLLSFPRQLHTSRQTDCSRVCVCVRVAYRWRRRVGGRARLREREREKKKESANGLTSLSFKNSIFVIEGMKM